MVGILPAQERQDISISPWMTIWGEVSVAWIIQAVCTPIQEHKYGENLRQTHLRRVETLLHGVSNFISYEQRYVEMRYIFVAVYLKEDTLSISQALNMPPLYQAHEKGRALIMYNASVREDIPVIIPDKDDLDAGTVFWDQPASTLGESKEMLDAYYETFHGTTYSETGYLFEFEKMLLPYLPYFSNCNTHDSYIPFWMAVEDEIECGLPDDMDEDWPRYTYPLPDADSTKLYRLRCFRSLWLTIACVN